MIKNLNVSSGKINWSFNDKDITFEIPDAFFASDNEEARLIRIDSGKNFIESKVYYYNFEGKLELFFDLELCTIEWFFQNNKNKLIIENMRQVGFFPQKQRIFVLCDDNEKQELIGYTLESLCLFKVKSPNGFKMKYFSKMKDEITIVCDGDKSNEDEHGRFSYNFLLDIDTGKLIKGSLAY